MGGICPACTLLIHVVYPCMIACVCMGGVNCVTLHAVSILQSSGLSATNLVRVLLQFLVPCCKAMTPSHTTTFPQLRKPSLTREVSGLPILLLLSCREAPRWGGQVGALMCCLGRAASLLWARRSCVRSGGPRKGEAEMQTQS